MNQIRVRILILSPLLLLFAAVQAESPFSDLAEQRLQCFDQPTKTEINPEEVKKKKKLDLNIRTLDAHTKHKELFRLLSRTDSKASTVLNKNSWRDLEIALGDHNAIANLHHVVDCTQTSFGSDYLLYKLTHPIDSPEQLIFQQNSVKELLANELLFKQLDTIFAAVAKSENNFFFMYQEEESFNKKIISSYYFTSTWPLLRNLKALNSNQHYLEGRSALGRAGSALFCTWLPITIYQTIYRGIGTVEHFNKLDRKRFELGEDVPENSFKEFMKVFFSNHSPETRKKGRHIFQRILTPWTTGVKMNGGRLNLENFPSWGDINKNLRDQIKITEEAITNRDANNLFEKIGSERKILESKLEDPNLPYVERMKLHTDMWDLEKQSRDLIYLENTKDALVLEQKVLWGYSAFLGLLQAQSMYFASSREQAYNNLTNYLHTQLISVATIIRAMNSCSLLIEKNRQFADGLVHKEDLHVLFDTTSKKVSQKLHKLVGLLLTNTFKGNASYFSLKGRVLAAYSLMQDVKEELAPALRALGEVETMLSTAKLYKKFEGKKVQFGFPTYLNANAPSISMSGMWNPFVDTNKVVENSITLGNTMPQNVILTGPNAGGKSTFLKGTCLSILLAQTIGIAPVKELAFTPFAKINTYMNITDDTAGGNSLFKSEVLRAQGLLETVKNLTSRNFSFSIMDEMFCGTSPKEGAAASYAVAKRLGEINNSILLLATHFPLLTELEAETKNFKNYQVRVVRHDNGGFSYPFKLEEGIANQNVAMDILQQQGFDASILKDATAVLNR